MAIGELLKTELKLCVVFSGRENYPSVISEGVFSYNCLLVCWPCCASWKLARRKYLPLIRAVYDSGVPCSEYTFAFEEVGVKIAFDLGALILLLL